MAKKSKVNQLTINFNAVPEGRVSRILVGTDPFPDDVVPGTRIPVTVDGEPFDKVLVIDACVSGPFGFLARNFGVLGPEYREYRKAKGQRSPHDWYRDKFSGIGDMVTDLDRVSVIVGDMADKRAGEGSAEEEFFTKDDPEESDPFDVDDRGSSK